MTIILSIVSIVSMNVFGQNHLLGLKGGLNLTNISSSNFISDTDSRSGFSGGVSYEYLLNNGVSFGADIIFNQRGFSNDLKVTDDFGISGKKGGYLFCVMTYTDVAGNAG